MGQSAEFFLLFFFFFLFRIAQTHPSVQFLSLPLPLWRAIDFCSCLYSTGFEAFVYGRGCRLLASGRADGRAGEKENKRTKKEKGQVTITSVIRFPHDQPTIS
jgi:hypothetical protein